MDLIASAVGSLGGYVVENMPLVLTNLITDGVIAGVGAVVVFLPQIILLFLFLSFLKTRLYVKSGIYNG
jgi:ferrous iron transport protein B